jgi:tetratricopeptide (TPR) repeat protein
VTDQESAASQRPASAAAEASEQLESAALEGLESAAAKSPERSESAEPQEEPEPTPSEASEQADLVAAGPEPVPGAPELPPDAALSMLDPEIRAELRSLSKNLAEVVGRHLAAAGMLMDDDPELALEHARYIRPKAARIGIVREAVGLTAYNAGEWAEALSELRAARRMSRGPGHIAVMADCERALGRPERALELAREGQALPLSEAEAIELRIVAAGARRDMGELDAAVVALQGPELDPRRREPWSARLFYAYADNLAATDRTEEAIRWFLNAAQADDDSETDAAERAVELAGVDDIQ